MQYFQDTLTLTAVATSLFDAFDLIGFDDAKITAADAPVKGMAKHPCTEIGQAIAVVAKGTCTVKAVGVIALGANVVSAAAGGVQTAGGTPVNIFGRALTAAADGDLVEILIS